jgi:glycosyltransferase involved in cell wall biosynthesis
MTLTEPRGIGRRPALPAHDGTIAVVLSGWPRLSETFAVNELTALARRGRLAGVFATKPGDSTLVQPDAAYLDPLVTRLRSVGPAAQGAELARHLDARHRPVAAIHGYFAHDPAEVAERAARLLDLPFSFSVHALDARKIDQRELARRCRAAQLVTTCNPETAHFIRQVGGRPVELAHGVDLGRFRPAPLPDTKPVELLAVGRLVAKKGFIHLIDAMAVARPGTRLRIVGEGPEGGRLRAQISDRQLQDVVELVGRCTHGDLPALFHSADVVVVPSVIDAAGDRDGLPNVVLEAMACGRPVVASRVAAIPSAVRSAGTSGDTGVLVPPGDPIALAEAITALAGDRARRHLLGANARRCAEANFDLRQCTSNWVDLLVTAHSLHEMTEATR